MPVDRGSVFGFLFRVGWLCALAGSASGEAPIGSEVTFPRTPAEVGLRMQQEQSADGTLQPSPPTLSVLWLTPIGYTCRVQRSTDLSTWRDATKEFAGDGEPIEFDTQAHSSEQLLAYRLHCLPAGSLAASGSNEAAVAHDPGLIVLIPAGQKKVELVWRLQPGWQYRLETSRDLSAWTPAADDKLNDDFGVYHRSGSWSNGRVYFYRLDASAASAVQLSTSHRRDPSAAPSGGKPALRHDDAHEEVAPATGTAPGSVTPENSAPFAIAQPRIVRDIQFETRLVPVPPNQHYAVIDLGVDWKPLGINNQGIVVGQGTEAGNSREMICWIAGKKLDVSAQTGQKFDEVLAIDDTDAMVGQVLENGTKKLLGFRVQKDGDGDGYRFIALTEDELRNFHFVRRQPVFSGKAPESPIDRVNDATADGVIVGTGKP